MTLFTTSEKLFVEAKRHFPGGVNSPVRAFLAVGGTPPFIVRAQGARVYDADGNAYLDYVGSWGPAILGHAHPLVLQELNVAMKNGLSFGAPTPKEIELAKKIKGALPSMEKLRFVSSGTEAAMSAIRVARGHTRRDKVIKFDGCYHGHADHLLVRAGSGAQTHGFPDSLGVPVEFSRHTLGARFNDLDSVEKLFTKNKGQVACVIVEPVMGNMGCILPQAGFLLSLRTLCDREGALLVFDEVITGFRLCFGGAQTLFGVKPDLTCLGKIIGGGLPVGAYGGRADVMDNVSPLGGVYQAGTLSGNPLAMAVGAKTLSLLSDGHVYTDLEKKGAQLEQGIKEAAAKAGTEICFNRIGSLFSIFFKTGGVDNADDARAADKERFAKMFHHFFQNGIYLAPSPFEVGFISIAHTETDIDRTLSIFNNFLRG